MNQQIRIPLKDMLAVASLYRQGYGLQKPEPYTPYRYSPSKEPAWMHIHLSKKERKGKTPQQQLALRKEKYVNAGGKEQV